jgi:acetyltransferase-like isoleucine patch superfamily enzyme
MTSINPHALIYPNVTLGEGAIVEPFALLGIEDRFHPKSELIIGDKAYIGSHCTIYSGVEIGDELDISDQTTIFTDNILGNKVRIGPKSIIKNGCRLGNNIRVNSQVFMERVIINDHVFIGPQTVFTDDMHPPCPRYKDCVAETYIESYVSIGANVTIGPGIRIGNHSQIYAGAVIINDVEPYSVIAGNPGRWIKGFKELKCKPGYFKKPFEWWNEQPD